MIFFKNSFKNKRVIITGHTGFKGSWLTLWLTILGAKVLGISNSIITKPSNFEAQKLKNVELDNILKLKISNLESLESNFQELAIKLQSIEAQLSKKTIALSSSQKNQDKLEIQLENVQTLASERMALLSALRIKFEDTNRKIQSFEQLH